MLAGKQARPHPRPCAAWVVVAVMALVSLAVPSVGMFAMAALLGRMLDNDNRKLAQHDPTPRTHQDGEP